MALAGLGRLGLWLHLRHGSGVSGGISLPEGQGPLLFLSYAQSRKLAADRISAILKKARPDLRIHEVNPGDPIDPDKNRGMMRHLLGQARPFAVLLLGTDLPAALISEAVAQEIPVILGEADLEPREQRWTLTAGMRRDLLNSLTMTFATDTASHETARRMGIAPRRVTMTGPITEIRDPLPCNEAELSVIADLLNGRHSWLATCVPASEEQAVLTAHRAALRQAHRTLLFLIPASAERIGPLEERCERNGLIVAQRAMDEEPLDDVQVLLVDSPEELGLWYRLAPVTYMGGTLSGDDGETRHPFEPAALGSAIVHGPATGRFATEWHQLDAGGAARQVANPDDLARVIAELTLPELVAELASNAWTVGTGGAGVAMQIAAYILDLLSKVRT
ncbi:3-deoxy-D-manno-octulosonic acid transferase [Paracoccus onubensis]|uniref:3-deoxy-D-manno-octulosonic acid transferase n=1 Tax=Paracoccus onubensis TaxID=1675788 RepID=A0A418SMR2_9RHOB|nr:glycosyltransferase N-terminal domain-containing protein [Paracoccus onubensis]RJE82248.1 3-deoxy-D-manno-octulosonic acid transferase [Paracoccus onubensis]